MDVFMSSAGGTAGQWQHAWKEAGTLVGKWSSETDILRAVKQEGV